MNKILHGPNIAGQSLADRVAAAKFSIAGQGLAKSVAKATTEEVMGPKKKHLDYLLKCTNEPNVSIPQLANLLIERTQNGNWVVVYKSLVSIHSLMNYGNERFTQYLASNNCTFNLSTFLDKGGVQGYDMSTYIRRYAKYLNEKACSYRTMAFDFCKVKRGKDDGLLRTMPSEKLLKALPILQLQVDALLEFDVSPNELTNGVINACFMLLFKDLIRLFACYNDGIINLLEKFFEMNKKNCKEALDTYKKFLVRMERTAEFLKVCESVGIDKGDIPDLAKAPSSLLEALEEHLKSLENAKKSGQPAPKVASKITSEISSFAAAATSGVNAAVISDDEKRRIIEEESKQLEQLKEQRLKESPTGSQGAASASVTNPFSSAASQDTTDLFGAGSPAYNTHRPSDDLLNLSGPSVNPFASVASNNPFAPAASNATATASSPWGSPSMPAQSNSFSNHSNSSMQNGKNFDANFDQAFGGKPSAAVGAQSFGLLEPIQPTSLQSKSNSGASGSSSGFDGFGDILQPANKPPSSSANKKLLQGDLDSSLASLAGNLNISPAQTVKRNDHQWNQMGASSSTKMTAGASPSWAAASQPNVPPYNQAMSMSYSMSPYGATSLNSLMNQYNTQPGIRTPIVNQNPALAWGHAAWVQTSSYSPKPAMAWGAPMGMTPMGPQAGYQAGMRPPGNFQQPMQPMGIMGGSPMFGQSVGNRQPSGLNAQSQPNDPFGAL